MKLFASKVFTFQFHIEWGISGVYADSVEHVNTKCKQLLKLTAVL